MKGSRPSLHRHIPRWLRLGIILSLILALGGDFIANERPWLVKYEGRWYFPILRGYFQAMGMADHHPSLDIRNEQTREYRMWRPPVVYSSNTIDAKHANFVSPLTRQQVSWRERHWLGTDQLGRDTLAGMLAGLRIAWWVGLGSVLIAAGLGLGFGILAGYFGNRFWYLHTADLVVGVIWTVMSVYFWKILVPFYDQTLDRGTILLQGCWWLGSAGLFYLWRRWTARWNRTIPAPFDKAILRLIEWLKAIPGVFLILGILGLIAQPSLTALILIIGLTSWPTIAQYTRAELLKVKHQPFVEAVKALGLSHYRILMVHILPVILGPLAITWAFGISNAILVESTLSFLGLGLSVDQISWGSLLSEARQHLSAWWLAVFPGLGIFLMVYGFNRLGEAILLALQPPKDLKPL